MNEDMQIVIRDALTVKSGIKFGIGLAIGASLVKSIDVALGRVFAPRINEMTEKIIKGTKK